ncbi:MULTISPECIES: hypothetical protein [unclassified Haladaptatus]|nr:MULTISPECIES: hypothetical protein [unclassified Haladaptatus]
MVSDTEYPSEESDGRSAPDLGDLVDRILNGGNDPSPSAGSR